MGEQLLRGMHTCIKIDRMDVMTYTQIAANVATVISVALGGPTLLLALLTYLDGRESSISKKNGCPIFAILGGFSKNKISGNEILT